MTVWLRRGHRRLQKKYPEITINELNPDAGSSDEIEAIKANKDKQARRRRT